MAFLVGGALRVVSRHQLQEKAAKRFSDDRAKSDEQCERKEKAESGHLPATLNRHVKHHGDDSPVEGAAPQCEIRACAHESGQHRRDEKARHHAASRGMLLSFAYGGRGSLAGIYAASRVGKSAVDSATPRDMASSSNFGCRQSGMLFFRPQLDTVVSGTPIALDRAVTPPRL